MGKIINYLNDPGWQPGIYDLKSYEEYAAIPALRSSDLKQLRRTPAHYKAYVEYPRSVTPALQKSFDIGKAFDVLVLDGREKFEQLIIIAPDLNKNTKAYKQWRSEQAPGAILMSQQEKDFILMMYRQAFKKQCFAQIFGGEGTPHRAIVWQDFTTQLWCKAEIDWICADGTVCDLKTAANADFWFFSRQAFRLNYPNQGAHYLSGLSQLTGIPHTQFKLAVVEVEPPFESHVFNVGLNLIDKAMVENELRMETLARCLEKDEWPGYLDQELDLDSGQYLFEDYEDDNGGDYNGF